MEDIRRDLREGRVQVRDGRVVVRVRSGGVILHRAAQSPPPVPPDPRAYDGAIAAARTCYSPRVIEDSEITDNSADSIGPLTFTAGHHTVFQHATFEFGAENVRASSCGRSCTSTLHNSEQSSQRFVKLGGA